MNATLPLSVEVEGPLEVHGVQRRHVVIFLDVPDVVSPADVNRNHRHLVPVHHTQIKQRHLQVGLGECEDLGLEDEQAAN